MEKENLTKADLAAAKATEDQAKKAAADQAAADKKGSDKPAEKVAAKPAKGDDFRDVFTSNPQADEIFVVDGMPFLEEVHALNHARGDKQKVKTVKR